MSRLEPAAKAVAVPEACKFCCAMTAGPQSEAYWDSPLVESSNFVVLPSLGSIRPGWLLVIPKQHFISSAVLPVRLMAEMLDVTCLAKELLLAYQGPVWLFEHGPVAHRRAAGCGVDHAHVHLVPFEGDLIDAADNFLPADVSFRAGSLVDCREAAAKGLDYLYVESEDGAGAFASGEYIGSQVFRKAIAAHDGISSEYDWRLYPRLENVKATVEKLRLQTKLSLNRPSSVATAVA